MPEALTAVVPARFIAFRLRCQNYVAPVFGPRAGMSGLWRGNLMAWNTHTDLLISVLTRACCLADDRKSETFSGAHCPKQRSSGPVGHIKGVEAEITMAKSRAAAF